MNDIRKRQNPVTVLASLPSVLEIRDIRLAAGYERKTAIEALFRWTRLGLVKPFAPGVYFNLIADPGSPESHVFEAASRVLRRPHALIGASALSDAGWTTQMPAGYELAIGVDRKVRTWKSMSGIVGEARSLPWFEAVAPYMIRNEGGFDRLPPALALVDAIASKERFDKLSRETRSKLLRVGLVTWHPDPDDISIPVDLSPEHAWEEMVDAADILNVSFEAVRNYALGVADLEDVVSAASSPREQRLPRC